MKKNKVNTQGKKKVNANGKKKISTNGKKKSKQYGGGSSDYVQLFHSYGADPAQLSRFTLRNIDNAPMFNPLSTHTIFPTGTSGIIPTGSYYDNIAPTNVNNTIGPPTPGNIQMGGGNVYYVTKEGKEITNRWIGHVYKFAETHNMTYPQALKDPRAKKSYKK